MSNKDTVASIKGALSPFWNLVALMLTDDLPGDKDAYARLLQDEAVRCEEGKDRIISLLNSIK